MTLAERYKAARETRAYIGDIEFRLTQPDIMAAIMEAREQGIHISPASYEAQLKGKAEGLPEEEAGRAILQALAGDMDAFGKLILSASAFVELPDGTRLKQLPLRREDVRDTERQMCLYDLTESDLKRLVMGAIALLNLTMKEAAAIAPFREPAAAGPDSAAVGSEAQ